MPYTLPRQADRLFVIAADELRIGGDAAIDRGERIARRKPQRMPCGTIALLPSPAIGQRHAVIAVSYRKIRIEAERELEFGEAILEPAIEKVDARQREMRPRVLAVGVDRSQRAALGDRHRFRHRLPAHVGAEHATAREHAQRLAVVGVDIDGLFQ